MMAEARYHGKMSSRARNKLSVRQVATITKVGIYSDGGGLYLRVRPTGHNWIFIGTFEGKRFELGLGIVFDVPLAKAREKAEHIRTLLVDGKDPRFERLMAKQRQATRFGAFAENLIDDIEGGFKNPKHRQQWRNSLRTAVGVGSTKMGFELQFRNGLAPFAQTAIANAKVVDALLKLGFVCDTAKERLYLPVKINADLLAKGFQENDLDKALAPVGNAIELAISAKAELDKIVEQVREAAKRK